MTLARPPGSTMFKRPTAFDLDRASGYLQSGITRRTNDEADLLDWPIYRNVSNRPNARVTGLEAPQLNGQSPDLPGPPMAESDKVYRAKLRRRRPSVRGYVGILTPISDARRVGTAALRSTTRITTRSPECSENSAGQTSRVRKESRIITQEGGGSLGI